MAEESEMRTAAILVVSDRCSRGETEDLTGPHLARLLSEYGWTVSETLIVPDDEGAIMEALKNWADGGKTALIFTAGGTGLGPRDVTPEATGKVVEKVADGIIQLMRSEGMKITPRAALSRAVAGVRGRTLIVNLPGSPHAAGESFMAIEGILAHGLEMLRGGGHPEAEKGGK